MKLLLLPILLAAATPVVAQAPRAARATPLTIGETFTIESRVLAETRRINVYRPTAWGEDDGAARPVLYMPDGGIQEDFLHIAGLLQISTLNGTMRPFILVGIENTQRRRDMTGPTTVGQVGDNASRGTQPTGAEGGLTGTGYGTGESMGSNIGTATSIGGASQGAGLGVGAGSGTGIGTTGTGDAAHMIAGMGKPKSNTSDDTFREGSSQRRRDEE